MRPLSTQQPATPLPLFTDGTYPHGPDTLTRVYRNVPGDPASRPTEPTYAPEARRTGAASHGLPPPRPPRRCPPLADSLGDLIKPAVTWIPLCLHKS